MPNIHSTSREALFDATLERAKLWDQDWKKYFSHSFGPDQAYDRPYILRQAFYSENPDYRHGHFYSQTLKSPEQIVQEDFPVLHRHAKFVEGTGGMVQEMICIGWRYTALQKEWERFHQRANARYNWNSMSQQSMQKLRENYSQVPDYLWNIGYGQEEQLFQATERDQQLISSFSGAWISRHINTEDSIYPEPWDHEEELGELTPTQAIALSEYLVKNWRLDHDRERPLALLKTSDIDMGQWKITGIMKENDTKWAEIKQFMQSDEFPTKTQGAVIPLSEDRICKLGTEILNRIRYDSEVALSIAAGPDSRIYLEIEKHMHYNIARRNPVISPNGCRTESFSSIATQDEPDPSWLAGMLAMSFSNRKYQLYEDLRRRVDITGGQRKLEEYISRRYSQSPEAEREFRHFLAENDMFTYQDYQDYLAQQEADKKAVEERDKANTLYEATLKGVAMGLQNTNQAGTKYILDKGPPKETAPEPDRDW